MKKNSARIGIISALFVVFTAAAANAECISNGSNLTESGSWCANMNNYNYCSNYSGCEWIDDAASISPVGQCYSNGSNLTEDGSWCANMNNYNYCTNYSGCEWLQGN